MGFFPTKQSRSKGAAIEPLKYYFLPLVFDLEEVVLRLRALVFLGAGLGGIQGAIIAVIRLRDFTSRMDLPLAVLPCNGALSRRIVLGISLVR